MINEVRCSNYNSIIDLSTRDERTRQEGILLGQKQEREKILKFINEQRDKGNMGKNIFNPGLCLLDLIKQIQEAT